MGTDLRARAALLDEQDKKEDAARKRAEQAGDLAAATVAGLLSVPDIGSNEVVQIVRVANELNVPFLPRGAGTSLAGGCLAVGGGVVIALTRMKKILEVNYRDRYAVVEPGVINLWLTNHLRGQGYHFAPDPSRKTTRTPVAGNSALELTPTTTEPHQPMRQP